MPLTQVGRNWIATAIMNSGPPTFFTNANARIGVGNSTLAVNATYADLQGVSKTRTTMTAAYPSLSTNTVSFQGSYGPAAANHAWQEVGIFNGATTAAVMLLRHLASLGTKTTGTWTLTDVITVST